MIYGSKCSAQTGIGPGGHGSKMQVRAPKGLRVFFVREMFTEPKSSCLMGRSNSDFLSDTIIQGTDNKNVNFSKISSNLKNMPSKQHRKYSVVQRSIFPCSDSLFPHFMNFGHI